jgi:hypothetical protein
VLFTIEAWLVASPCDGANDKPPSLRNSRMVVSALLTRELKIVLYVKVAVVAVGFP